jgi:regulatory protein
MSFCATERSRKEVRDKLYSFGLEDRRRGGRLLDKLTKDNFLNEERFAKAFAGGQVPHEKWGRLTIRLELKGHGLPPELVRKGLQAIDPDDYESTLRDLA